MKTSPNIHFLMIVLQTFRKPSKYFGTARSVNIVITDIIRGKMPGTEGVSPKLVQNFISGYEAAIKKYGEPVANERMKDYLVKLITTNSHYTEKVLYEMLDKAFGTAEMLVDGIHIQQDENGEYTEIKNEE